MDLRHRQNIGRIIGKGDIMNMIGKNLDSSDLKNVSGGAGNAGAQGIIGMENYASKRTACPRCSSAELKDKNMTGDNGVSVPGQICKACGYSWTYGSVSAKI